jgi:hypothetical protein
MPPPTLDTLISDLPGLVPGADALLDLLEVTCELKFQGVAADQLSTLRARLVEAGVVTSGARAWDNVSFRWRCPRSGKMLVLEGALRLAPVGAGFVMATSASVLRLNPLAFLREQVAPVCAPGLDGRPNVVGGPEGDRPLLLGLQLLTVSDLLDAFLAQAEVAAGSPVSARLLLRRVELNRDLLRPGAAAVAHGIAREPNPWFRVGSARSYAPGPGLETEGNYVTVTWHHDARDTPIRMKFYAKAGDLLRTEVCYDNAHAIRHTVNGGRSGSPVPPADGGAGLAAQLRGLAELTVPALDAMAAHAAAVDGPQKDALDLVVALAPLLRVGAPRPPGRAGRPAEAATQAAARDVLYHLVELGRYDASALRTNGTVRKALDRIAREGGLVMESRGRSALYTVPPDRAAARQAMRRAFWPEDGTAQVAGTIERHVIDTARR